MVSERITSTSNPKIKRIRALQSRKARDESGRFFVEGIRLVAEAATAGAAVETLVVAPELLTSDFGRTLVEQMPAGVPVLEVSGAVFGSLSRKEGPQGLGAVVHQRWEPLPAVRLSDDALWVALDAVQDAGNVGTILRTADATGVEGVLFIGATVDPYDPVAVRASMGALFTQRLARCTWPELRDWAARRRCALVGTSGAAASEYRDVVYPRRLVLVMGSEREGLSAEQQAACDLTVRLPMVGRADSLNLAVATGVVLYEILHQRRHAGRRL